MIELISSGNFCMACFDRFGGMEMDLATVMKEEMN